MGINDLALHCFMKWFVTCLFQKPLPEMMLANSQLNFYKRSSSKFQGNASKNAVYDISAI